MTFSSFPSLFNDPFVLSSSASRQARLVSFWLESQWINLNLNSPVVRNRYIFTYTDTCVTHWIPSYRVWRVWKYLYFTNLCSIRWGCLHHGFRLCVPVSCSPFNRCRHFCQPYYNEILTLLFHWVWYKMYMNLECWIVTKPIFSKEFLWIDRQTDRLPWWRTWGCLPI